MEQEVRARAEEVEAVFRHIAATRMEGVPILNPALAVEAAAMEVWGEGVILALVTPWFINVMLLPGADERPHWEDMAVGQSTVHALPGGRFSFIAGREEGIGPYRMCSLFSPVLEFADHETACATAGAALAEMLREEQEPEVQMSRRDLFRRAVREEAEPA
ncbi:[NiFe]-hydrogenase assembly chaperone HybE [Aestuariivirga litoralis]|uniref:[NiFe]-hydrogenase assembly chaperone HybE n=1 Tax=Aestuariivirga litoralis TaxID=2650924 RepID=UPI0013798A44|nr:[NiFe]-hydrogenase assembly chaperone HybE [Aestuariivirga litoralis]